ncbi:MAG: glycosyltransferase family 2 protein [Candidatus Pacebacteria bacterium]|nr:glycosyltransferase family 2 protein [Candidatus Paceibacterota bacterium]
MEPFSVIIPAYNEEKAVRKTVSGLKTYLETNFFDKYEIIVVNDGSTDATAKELEGMDGIKVITHPKNKGYGASIKEGVENSKYEWIIWFDGDGQHQNEYIPSLLEKRKTADMVLGERKGYKGPLIRQPGKKILKWTAEFLTGQKIPDINSGFRIFRKEHFNRFKHLLPDGFSTSTTLTMCFLTEGLFVAYVPIEIKKREGKSTVSMKHGTQTFLLILRMIMLFNPLKIFLPPSVLTLVFGIIFGVDGIIRYGSFPTSAVVIIIAGMLLFFNGLLADQIAVLRRERK